MENIKLEDLLAVSSKGIEMGSKSSVCAAFILGAQAITIIGGIEGRAWGLLGLALALIAIQTFQTRFSIAQNVPAMLKIGIVILVLGPILQACVLLGVPGFVSQAPQFTEVVHHLAMIAGVFLIISGIAGVQASNTAKAVIKMIGGAGAP
jgi:hypothetical protein